MVFRDEKELSYNRQYLKALAYLQEILAKKITLKDKITQIKYIGGGDVFYCKNSSCAYASVVILDYSTTKIVETITVKGEVNFPYISSYLCFRESFLLLEAISYINQKVDCYLFDGNGILHPRSMGLATFLGILLHIPTIGCAKRLLLGEYQLPAKFRGSFTPILVEGKIKGFALRTKDNTKEIFVSPGWGISLERAKEIVLNVSFHRIPEPLRWADMIAKQNACKISANVVPYTTLVN